MGSRPAGAIRERTLLGLCRAVLKHSPSVPRCSLDEFRIRGVLLDRRQKRALVSIDLPEGGAKRRRHPRVVAGEREQAAIDVVELELLEIERGGEGSVE